MDVLGAMQDTVKLGCVSNMPTKGPIGYPHIAGMLIQMQEGKFSYGKMNRWLAWAQCAVAVARGADDATLHEMKQIRKRHAGAAISDTDKAAKIIADMFSASVTSALGSNPPRAFLYSWEQDALEWLKTYRAVGGTAPICHWTGTYMRNGPPPWRA